MQTINSEFPDIAQIVRQDIILKRNKFVGCNPVWASEAAHDCMRYLVYQQCNFEEGKQVSENLQLVFQEGENQEKQIIDDIKNAGIRIENQYCQIPVKIKSANISGKLDCVAVCKNNEGKEAFLPVEIKSMSDIVFNSVNTVEDLKKHPWTRKYYGQIQLYLKNDLWSYNEGYLLAKNKSTGEIKLIKDFDGSNTIKFNQEYWNNLVKRAKEVKKYVTKIKLIQDNICNIKETDMDFAEKEMEIEALETQISYPERIKYDLKVCKNCKYEHICITDLKGSVGNFIDNASILEAVEDYSKAETEREKYKSAEKEYKRSLETLKELFPLEEKLYVSEKYLIQTKVRKVKDTQYLTFDVEKTGS